MYAPPITKDNYDLKNIPLCLFIKYLNPRPGFRHIKSIDFLQQLYYSEITAIPIVPNLFGFLSTSPFTFSK